jgi:hypothetical protein
VVYDQNFQTQLAGHARAKKAGGASANDHNVK